MRKFWLTYVLVCEKKQFDHDSFVSDIRLIDDMIIDLCPTISNRVEKQYEKKFNAVKRETP